MLLAFVHSGCSAGRPGPDGVIRREGWTYLEKPGQRLTTAHYHILTTAQEQPIAQSLPAFLEASLARHRLFAGTRFGGPALPAPPGRMTLFLFADREEWAQFTRQTIDASAYPLLAIEIGGYAAGGRAVLFALPPKFDRLTLKIAAHEGWHQYVQRSFREPLPTWVDEMVAVLAEGFYVDESGRFRFEPLLNPERFSQLAMVLETSRWRPLREILSGDPTRLLSSEPHRAVEYYAQLWALGLYLAVDPNRWEGVQRVLRDAAAGRLARTLGSPSPEAFGTMTFARYITHDIDAAEAGYLAFARALVDGASTEARSDPSPR